MRRKSWPGKELQYQRQTKSFSPWSNVQKRLRNRRKERRERAFVPLSEKKASLPIVSTRRPVSPHRYYPQIGTRRPTQNRLNRYLRLAVHPSDCTRRKENRKLLMKKLAARASARGGKAQLRTWRRQRYCGGSPGNRTACYAPGLPPRIGS